MRQLVIAAVLVMVSGVGLAAPVSMICENPRRDYVAVFDPDGRTLILDPDTSATAYTVLAIEGLLVAGAVGQNSGLAFLASFSEPLRIDLYDGPTVIQSDPCRAAPKDGGI